MVRRLLAIGVLFLLAATAQADIWDDLDAAAEECRLAEEGSQYQQFLATGAKADFEEAKKGAILPLGSADYLAERAGEAYRTGLDWQRQGVQYKFNAIGFASFAHMIPPPSSLAYAQQAISSYNVATDRFANARERFRHAQQCWEAAAIIYRGQA